MPTPASSSASSVTAWPKAAITVMRDARNLSGDHSNATFADMCFVLFEKMNAEDASGKTKTPRRDYEDLRVGVHPVGAR